LTGWRKSRFKSRSRSALDRQFQTIDFLTLLVLKAMPSGARGRFLG
jgi:hypothetical protein